VTALLLVACGDDAVEATPEASSTASNQTVASDAPDTIVPITLTEWSLVTDSAVAPPGSVVFDVTNAGTVEHQLVIVRTSLAANALPVAGGAVDTANLEVVGEIETLARGDRDRDAFLLQAGAHVLICNIAGHYEAGMRLGFTVR
jgi:uncharacterized cupredoxin-like copper-binding protein